MKTFVTLVGLIFILEGLPYFAFPKAMQEWLRQLTEMPPALLRAMGLAAVLFGFLLCYITQRTDWLH